MEGILAIFIAVMAAIIIFLALKLRSSGSSAKEKTITSNLETVRTIGHLSAFKAFTKEIVTETDHSWGTFGQKYLSWVLSNKKMAMIFEFEIDFRYDLRNKDFSITETALGCFIFTLPPCIYEAHIRNIMFYDEQGAKLFPWLLPDLLNGFIPSGFSETDKNRLVTDAKTHAEQQAKQLIESLESDVQASAQRTLESIATSLGARKVDFEFTKAVEPDLKIEYLEKGKVA